MAASAYLTLDNNQSDVPNYQDITNIVLPLIIYIMNTIHCSLFYLEARSFQMRGYTQLFIEASKLSRINFCFVSIYYVIASNIYAFLLHHKLDWFGSGQHDINVIFLGIWFFSYVFIIGSLLQFGHKFYAHNREKPKPDLFFPVDSSSQSIRDTQRSIPTQISVVDDQTEVIQKLYRDKITLMRQLESMKKKYERAQRDLESLQMENTSLVLGAGNESLSGGGVAINNDIMEMKNAIQRLKSKLRNEREQNKTLSTQIETKKTMLDAQISETGQLRNQLQVNSDRISQLMNDKESLERSVNGANDEKDDLALLYQVKEQEVEIAKKENERLRRKMQQMIRNSPNESY